MANKTLATLRDDIKNLCDEENSTIPLSAYWNSRINTEQQYISALLRPREMQTTGLKSTVNGTPTYSLPTDYHDMIAVYYNDGSDWKELIRADKYALSQKFGDDFQDNATGEPDYYYIYGNNIGLYNVTDYTGTNNLKFEYYKKPTTLVNDTDIIEFNDIISELIEFRVAYKFKIKDDEMNQVMILKSNYLDLLREVKQLMIEETNVIRYNLDNKQFGRIDDQNGTW